MAEPAKASDVVTEFKRTEDFATVYCNNAQFEASVWDLKFILGVLDQRGGKVDVEQHTAVTIPWIQAKLFSFFLQMNIAVHELQFGKIIVPNAVIPPRPEPPSQETMDKDSTAKATYEAFSKIYDQFISSL